MIAEKKSRDLVLPLPGINLTSYLTSGHYSVKETQLNTANKPTHQRLLLPSTNTAAETHYHREKQSQYFCSCSQVETTSYTLPLRESAAPCEPRQSVQRLHCDPVLFPATPYHALPRHLAFLTQPCFECETHMR